MAPTSARRDTAGTGRYIGLPITAVSLLNLGFNHVYELTFVDEQARDTYLPHPAHVSFGDLLGELDAVESAFVVDYLPQE